MKTLKILSLIGISGFISVSDLNVENKHTKIITENSSYSFEKFQEEKIIKACDAYKYIGTQGIVVGKIVGVHRSKKNHIFLNFEKPYPNQCFTAVIFASTLYNNFGSFNERSYLGKTVQVSGFIKEYKGKPEIILNYPDQIKVLK
jgi:hypothetical protein